MWDKLWHKFLRRPYRLAVPIDEGSGIPVILLHGVGRSSVVWQSLVAQLAHKPFRVLAFDLLGFGQSPKPQWSDYAVDIHARAVIKTIMQFVPHTQVLLVGHSMGCLVAVRVAYLRPDLVRHLILYEMPLYGGLPDKRIYQLRLQLYTSIYNRVIRYQPSFREEKRRLAERIARLLQLPEPTEETWQPFIRSLENTIMHQQTAQDIKQLTMPMDVIYGNRDMFVIRGKVQVIFGKDAKNITAHTLRAGHSISANASKFIALRIEQAVTEHVTPTTVLLPNKTNKSARSNRRGHE